MKKIIVLLTAIFSIVFNTYTSYSQCNAPGFTVTPTNGTCLLNSSIDVQIPGASTCSGWTFHLTIKNK